MTFKDFIEELDRKKPVQSYRLNDIVGLCLERQACGRFSHVDMRDLAYSGGSLNETRERYDENEYLSESHFKTFDTETLIRYIAKTVSKTIGAKTIVAIGQSRVLFFICDDSKTSTEPSEGGESVFIRVFQKNIENGVADVVDFEICADERLDVKSDLLVKNMADAGLYCGYDYVSHNRDATNQACTIYSVVFEARHSKTRIVSTNKLYHLAPFSLKEKILKAGLVLKSKSSNGGAKLDHPDRVYFFTRRLSDEQLTSFAKALKKKSVSYSNGGLNYENRMALFEIDISGLPNLKLFRDGMLSGPEPEDLVAVYSYQTIPPDAVKFVKEIDF